jgi:asparagine synthase (glutamine-hydrolysing)
MSGIGGILKLDGVSPGQADFQSLMAGLAHRGPDGEGTWLDQSVALGHRMLWTTPESLHEKLPLQRDGLTITADARIDNRSQLIPQLDFRNRPLDSIADSEIILAAYLKWGEDCPGKLIGDFAFAIWDERKQHLFCARDYFGVKPFYYCHMQGKSFAFASEVQALLRLPDTPRVLNEVKIADYLLELFEDKSRTFYQHILRLPPAHHLTISRSGTRMVEYWRLDPTAELRLASDDEYAEQYRDLFVEAVRARVRSAYPVGSTLSGGLDSSSVATVAQSVLKEQAKTLHTFSLVFGEVKKSDESPYIKAVLERGQYEPHFIQGDQLSLLGDLDTILKQQGQPFYSPQYYLTQSIWRAAQESGVRVVLEGLMGDNVVGHGFSYLNDLARQWRWLELYAQVKALTENHEDPAPVRQLMRKYIWQDGIKSHVPKPILQLWRTLRGRKPPQLAIPPVFNPDYARRIGLLDRLQMLARQGETRHSARHSQYHDLINGVVPTALEVYGGGTTPFAIDARFPFLDRRLVEFSLATPPRLKLRGGYSRWIARQALKGYLPDEIRWRSSKGDLGWNFVHSLNREAANFERLILGQGKALEPYVDINYVVSLCRQLSQGSRSEHSLLIVFLAAVLISWFNREDVSSQS